MAKRVRPVWSGAQSDGTYYRPESEFETARIVRRSDERSRALGSALMFTPALVLTILDMTGVWQIGMLWALTTLWLPTAIYTGAVTISALFRAIFRKRSKSNYTR